MVSNQISKEKRTHHKIKSNLKNFTTKLVSFVRTSPLDFALILIEPSFEKDYKIMINVSDKAEKHVDNADISDA